jgi:ATP-dependent Clp protease adaptor protein ClpS
MTKPFWEEDSDVLIDEEIGLDNAAQLIVFNDEVNTFEWVIKSFRKVLQYSSEQAEQLAYIIHLKGKATVKTAGFDELRPFKDALVDRGLSAVIEK